ncbi:MAG: ATP-dependent RNA helicase HrpA [Betaproteobacteria bacterium]|nr:ATP-dependent RNA helicase HrpA [Betaproteobacteria bacterium]
MASDRGRLGGRLARLRDGKGNASDELGAIDAAIDASVARLDARRARRPRITYAPDLPVSEKHEEIARAIERHQVVIVSGETGSGKTTQLPKICLDLGRGSAGMIGHTQPRRIAARTVAGRIAQELASPLGDVVGYKVRFNDTSGPDVLVKLMTDGILLAETVTDRHLRAYDTIIVDEAHERSLNIDFLLGYLRQLLPRRPDLKVIITSATIDARRFSRHFMDAPVIEVSGRLYPVDVRYRPAEECEDGEAPDLAEEIGDALDALYLSDGPGDALVFLPGEREIRETAEYLRKHPVGRARVGGAGVEILPLFARLSAAEQDRVFKPGTGHRVVIATNVAETSLTVPRIRYVIDPGLARINRYSYRNKVEMLQVEPISRASANQRAGRCGRVMSGVCVRLYAEDDFAARPEFTDPEILRSSLASVILRMKALKLGEPESFPFVEPPLPKMIADGYQLLAELGAVDARRSLTAVGSQLARLPIDPRIARMIVEAKRQNCLREVLVIASALSVQDPRDRPLDKQEAADSAHAQFVDERSDFLAFVKIWDFYDELLKHKKSNRRLQQDCRDHFLSWLRLREWRDLHGQLHALVSEMGWRENEKPAGYPEIHKALLSGLLGNVGMKAEEGGEYLGARGIRFHVFPGSALRRKQPRWIMAAELTETTRLFARCVASIEPDWIEQLAPHIAHRHYFDPHWEKKSAQVVGYERVTVYGLTVVPRRRVSYGQIDPVESRRIFIRGALVEGDVNLDAPFLRANRALVREVQGLEHKSRRHDVLVDPEVIADFYSDVVPEGIFNLAAFERWRRDAERANPRLLYLTRERLMRHAAEDISAERFPDTIEMNGVRYRLAYRFEPGHPLDGVTMIVPLHLLNQIDERRCEWLVPGLLRDKLTHLIKGLPKGLRKHFVPVPQVVTAVLSTLEPDAVPLTEALGLALRASTGVEVPGDAWDESDVPAHLRMNYRVVDDNGGEVAVGRDLPELRLQLGVKARRQFTEQARSTLERSGATRWEFGDLPEQVAFTRAGQNLVGYPAVVDEGRTVSVVLLDTEQEADAAMRRGLRRLFQLSAVEQVKYVSRNLPGLQEMALRYILLGDLDGRQQDKSSAMEKLQEELVTAICDRAFFVEDSPIRTQSAFEARVVKAKTRLTDVAAELCRIVADILTEYHQLRPRLQRPGAQAWQRLMNDIRAQLRALMPSGFIASTPFERLRNYPRYLRAVGVRLDKFPSNPARDAQWQETLSLWNRQWQQRLEADRARGVRNPRLEEFRWMLEELRVSLWAQQLKTPYPVSFKRVEKAWTEI